MRMPVLTVAPKPPNFPASSSLFRSDPLRRGMATVSPIITTIAGTDWQYNGKFARCKAVLGWTYGVATDANGKVYIADAGMISWCGPERMVSPRCWLEMAS
jgi:hypothetical protein